MPALFTQTFANPFMNAQPRISATRYMYKEPNSRNTMNRPLRRTLRLKELYSATRTPRQKEEIFPNCFICLCVTLLRE